MTQVPNLGGTVGTLLAMFLVFIATLWAARRSGVKETTLKAELEAVRQELAIKDKADHDLSLAESRRSPDMYDDGAELPDDTLPDWNFRD